MLYSRTASYLVGSRTTKGRTKGVARGDNVSIVVAPLILYSAGKEISSDGEGKCKNTHLLGIRFLAESSGSFVMSETSL